MKQGELFEKDTASGKQVTSLPLAVVYLSLAFLFSTVALLVYLLWDFGIAGRVILFLVLLLVIVHAAMFIAKQLFDSIWPRR
jgi:hypothetical protein